MPSRDFAQQHGGEGRIEMRGIKVLNRKTPYISASLWQLEQYFCIRAVSSAARIKSAACPTPVELKLIVIAKALVA
jgi:hypothetical protein